MISEILNKLDIKTTPFLVAVLVVLVIARIWYAQTNVLLELSIILLSVYLFIIFYIVVFFHHTQDSAI